MKLESVAPTNCGCVSGGYACASCNAHCHGLSGVDTSICLQQRPIALLLRDV